MKRIFRILWNRSPQEVFRKITRKFRYLFKGNGSIPDDYSLNVVLRDKKHMNKNVLIDRWERYWRVAHNIVKDDLRKNYSFKGKRVLELGCGPLYGWGPMALYLGAEEFYYLEPALIKKTVYSETIKERYFKPLFFELKAYYGGSITLEDYIDRIKSKCFSIDLEKNNLPIDMILSNSVLEHIPEKKLTVLMNKVFSMCSSGANFMHIVDFDTHGFLELDLSGLYSLDNKIIANSNKQLPINLLRKSNIEEILITSGFNLNHSIIYRNEDFKDANFDSSWEKYSDEDLKAKTVFFIGNK